MATASQIQKQLDKIVEGEGTKAGKARALFALDIGLERKDVVDLLDMSYSQVHSIWKSLGNESEPRAAGGHFQKAVEHEARRQNNMRFSPSQTRYVTQDGHVVVRVDDKAGHPVCRNCNATLDFSLAWLAFVHKFSKKDPTHIEDRYEQN